MTDLIRGFISSLFHLDASLVQCTGWLALICFPKAEMDLEKRLDKLLAGFELNDYRQIGILGARDEYPNSLLRS